MRNQKQIVIIGAGMAGMAAVLEIGRLTRRHSLKVTLIDRRDYQLFAPNLYEVATSPEEFTSVSQLSESVCIPVKEMLRGTEVQFLKGEVKSINQRSKTVSVGGKSVLYDYLVVSCGSASDYYDIPGAQQYALPLKTVTDALAIRNRLEFIFQSSRYDVKRENIRIVVAGGGYAGVEFAAELSHELEVLCWKNQYPFEKVEVMLVEMQSRLLPGMAVGSHRVAYRRLAERGVRILLSTAIVAVYGDAVHLVHGDVMRTDLLVWTTGTRAASVPFVQPEPVDRRGRIMVNQFLQLEKRSDIFAVGDVASVQDKQGQPLPGTAYFAEQQGRHVARVIANLLQNKKLQPYRAAQPAFVFTLGGKWAVLEWGRLKVGGFLAYALRELIHVRYFSAYLGIVKALRYVWFQVKVNSRND